jgi:hypothetical protein
MATLSHQVWIRTPTARLYDPFATEEGIGRWWDKPKAVRSPSGLAWEFNPGPEHGVLVANVLEMIQDRRVEWEFVSRHPKHSPAFAWTGTHVVFEISRRAVPPWASERVEMAILDFRHSGWDERNEYFGFCNFQWGEALRKLKQWCESDS